MKISLYENFISDYGKLVSTYRDFQVKYKKDQIELWDKYRNVIDDIFSEMYHEHKLHDDYTTGKFHCVEGSTYDKFLNYLDHLFIEHFGDIEFFNEKLSRNPLQFKSDISNVDKFIEDVFECVSKFKMIGDSFGLKIQFGYEGNWTAQFRTRENIDDIKTEVNNQLESMNILRTKKKGGSDIIVRFYLRLVSEPV